MDTLYFQRCNSLKAIMKIIISGASWEELKQYVRRYY